MAKRRVVIMLEPEEIRQIKVYCDANTFAYGKWLRATILKAAGVKAEPVKSEEKKPEDKKELF